MPRSFALFSFLVIRLPVFPISLSRFPYFSPPLFIFDFQVAIWWLRLLLKFRSLSLSLSFMGMDSLDLSRALIETFDIPKPDCQPVHLLGFFANPSSWLSASNCISQIHVRCLRDRHAGLASCLCREFKEKNSQTEPDPCPFISIIASLKKQRLLKKSCRGEKSVHLLLKQTDST